ncbi:hypothetical protein [Thiocapsa sp. N5-Cardenillas]|uniref:hypothetical protein n=1 Tax=Thiocapsa sp. N5-Cardenillas TaxID=3137397 RepID=UPI0035B02834
MSTLILPNSGTRVSVPASSLATFYSDGAYSVVQITESSPVETSPVKEVLLFAGSGAYTTAAFSAAAVLQVQSTGIAAASPVYAAVGTAPVIVERLAVAQGAPGALNTTGTLTAALIMGGLVTSTTAAGVTATLDTGAVMDAASTFAIGDVFYWTAINTGGNAFTVTAAASGHTVVGAGAVAAGTSGRFATRKTAAATFITYRV